jgi:hypothetical protein
MERRNQEQWKVGQHIPDLVPQLPSTLSVHISHAPSPSDRVPVRVSPATGRDEQGRWSSA